MITSIALIKQCVSIQSHMAPILLKLKGIDIIVLMTKIGVQHSDGIVVHSTDSTFRPGYSSSTWDVHTKNDGGWEIYKGEVILKNTLLNI